MEKTRSKINFRLCWFLSLSMSILFLSGDAFAKGGEDFLEVNWFPGEVHQGEICVVDVSASTEASLLTGEFQEKVLSFYEIKKGEFRTLLGLDLDAGPGIYELTISARDRAARDRGCEAIESIHQIRVLEKDFEVQRLTLPKKMVVLDKKTGGRVGRESKKVNKIWKKGTGERLWDGEFIRPVNGKVLSPFGVRRILNDLPRSPHSGIDLRAKMGEDILCSNTGIVVLVDDLYFSGKSVIVDHGQGLYTMYFHLSGSNVKEGQHVGKGKVLGFVGSSGRATGPHLHWGVRLHGARVDPFSLLRLK